MVASVNSKTVVFRDADIQKRSGWPLTISTYSIAVSEERVSCSGGCKSGQEHGSHVGAVKTRAPERGIGIFGGEVLVAVDCTEYGVQG